MTRVAPIGKSDEYDYLFKIVLTGDDYVGKSSFLNMFVHGKPRDSYQSTMGVEFASRIIEVDGKTVKLQIWDTAGQERYRNITRSYYRGAHGFLVMFDLTEEKTFISIKANWLRQIAYLATEDVPVVLVGNKLDRVGVLNRSIDFDVAQEFASDVGVEYYELSSSNGDMVHTVMQDLSRLIMSREKAQLEAPKTSRHLKAAAGKAASRRRKSIFTGRSRRCLCCCFICC